MKLLEYLHTKAAHRATYGALLGSMLLVLLGYPILSDLGLRMPGVLSIFFVIMLFGCLATAIEKARAFALFFALVILLEIVASAFDIGGTGAESIPQHAARFIVLLITSWILVRDVMRATAVTIDTILGAICVYLLVAMATSEVYSFIYLMNENAFNVSAEVLVEALERGEHMWITTYFSFVTMTTLGYGDITPATGAIRSIAMLQAVFGQLYIAIIVARLVAIQVAGGPAAPKH